jgi:hypothetical protein
MPGSREENASDNKDPAYKSAGDAEAFSPQANGLLKSGKVAAFCTNNVNYDIRYCNY